MIQSANDNKFLSSTSVRHSIFAGPYSNPPKVNIQVDICTRIFICMCMCMCVGVLFVCRDSDLLV